MEPQRSYSKQEWRPQGGGQGGSQEPAIIYQPEGDNLHLKTVFGGHAAEDAFLEGRINNRPQDTEIPREDAGVFLNTVIPLPSVGGVEGAHRAREKDGGVRLHHHFFGGSSTLLQSCRDRNCFIPNLITEDRSHHPQCILDGELEITIILRPLRYKKN